VTARPDTTPPLAVRSNEDVLLALDPVRIEFTEPADLSEATTSLTNEGASIEHTAAPIEDPASGLSIGVIVQPQAMWPTAAAPDLAIAQTHDAAGNALAGSVQLMTAAPPDSNANLGFEDGLQEWIARGVGGEVPGWTDDFRYFDEDGEEQVVLAAEGDFMAVLPPEASVVAFLTPPGTATSLMLDVGLQSSSVASLQAEQRGFFIELATGSGTTLVADGASLPMASSSAVWTGLSTIAIPLTEATRDGFWLVIRSDLYRPPFFLPTVIVDDLRFSP
jgi:hypothetical protein